MIRNILAQAGAALALWALRQSEDPRYPTERRVPYSPLTVAGVVMNGELALQVSAVWACVRYLSQSIAGLPWHVMRDGQAGGEQAPSNPVDWLLRKRPNPEWSAFQFRESLMSWSLRHGNGYAEIERDAIARPIALWPIHPDRVEPMRDNGRLVYEVQNSSGRKVTLEASDMFHLRGFGDGVVGVNVMEYAAQSIGWARAAQIFGAAFFGNGLNLGGIVTSEKGLTPEGKKLLETELEQRFKGPRRAKKWALLDAGMKVEQVTTSPNEAQFLETNQHLVEEVCRWFGVPPHKVMHLLRATFSNIEHQSIEVVQDSVMPWAIRLEQEADYKLFGQRNRQGFYTKLNLNGLLRADAKSRGLLYKMLREAGALSANDIRRFEDMNTIGEAGDKYVMQGQYTTLERIGEQPVTGAASGSGGVDRERPPANDDDLGEDDDEALAALRELTGGLEHVA